MNRDTFYRYIKNESGYYLVLKITHGILNKEEKKGEINYSYTFVSPVDMEGSQVMICRELFKLMRDGFTFEAKDIDSTMKNNLTIKFDERYLKFLEKNIDLKVVWNTGKFDSVSKQKSKDEIERAIEEEGRVFSFEVSLTEKGKLLKPIADHIQDDMILKDVKFPQKWCYSKPNKMEVPNEQE